MGLFAMTHKFLLHSIALQDLQVLFHYPPPSCNGAYGANWHLL
jgi:hypothetical protein